MILLALSPLLAFLLLCAIVVQRVGLGRVTAFIEFSRVVEDDALPWRFYEVVSPRARVACYALVSAAAGGLLAIGVAHAAAIWVWLVALDFLEWEWRIISAFREGRA